MKEKNISADDLESLQVFNVQFQQAQYAAQVFHSHLAQKYSLAQGDKITTSGAIERGKTPPAPPPPARNDRPSA